jgi:hypothetical protein
VREVLFHRSFGDAEAMREVSGRAARAGEHVHDLPSDGLP